MAATANLAYLGRGTRQYGLRPVIGRSRGYWELQWVWSGGARPDRADSEVKPGKTPCLYISHPESPHGWTDDGGNATEVFVLHFRAVPTELAAQVETAKTLIVELGENEQRRHSARLDEVLEMTRAGDARLALKLEQILIEVALLALDRAAPVAAKGRPANRVEHALHWFAENIGENPSAEAVAQAVGVSPAHLRRLFAETGRASPRAELARLRMTAAQRCLREGWKLERVAHYLGFSEASAFSRAFTTVCGFSPRRWLAREKSREAGPAGVNESGGRWRASAIRPISRSHPASASGKP